MLASKTLATNLSPLFTPGENLLRAIFLDPDPTSRALYGDQWESLAHSAIAGVHALIGAEVDDPLLDEAVGELSVRSDHFRSLWARYDIRAKPAARPDAFITPRWAPWTCTTRTCKSPAPTDKP